jgi:hypothetical protein
MYVHEAVEDSLAFVSTGQQTVLCHVEEIHAIQLFFYKILFSLDLP